MATKSISTFVIFFILFLVICGTLYFSRICSNLWFIGFREYFSTIEFSNSFIYANEQNGRRQKRRIASASKNTVAMWASAIVRLGYVQHSVIRTAVRTKARKVEDAFGERSPLVVLVLNVYATSAATSLKSDSKRSLYAQSRWARILHV